MKVNKKLISFFTSSLLALALSGVDFQARLMPSLAIPFEYDNTVALQGTLSLDINAITIRKKDDIYFSAQATPQLFMIGGLTPFAIYDFNGAAGYNFKITDRISAGGELLGGIWIFPEQKNLKIKGSSGIQYGIRLSGDYRFTPDFSVSATAAFKQYYYKPKPLMNRFEIGIGVTYNFTKGLFGRTAVSLEESELKPLFPVFYSRYENNPFGKVTFVNGEKNDITDVQVTVYIEQFMSVPKTVATFERVRLGESFSAELSAFLNENMLNQLQNQLSDAVISVKYRNLGKAAEFSQVLSLQTLTRNSMSWEDDRSAAAFVSAKDGAVQRFIHRIQMAMKDKLTMYPNQQYAEAVFKVLKAYGINYVIDPASAFTDNVGTASIDFLQFPYQTLMYHGGDCDDLSILNCSLLEALGISTAFITIPGHIYMAYDSGIPLDMAESKLGRGKYIAEDGRAWIPVEITVPQDSYALALSLGMKQWNKYPQEHALIPLYRAWEEYKPVSVPASDISLQFPKDALK